MKLKIAGNDYRFSFPPNFNLAPSQRAGVILPRAGELVGESLRWGFLAPWAKDAKFAPINARSETVFTNAVFRGAIGARRCLVPASGWYEWQTVAGKKQPWRTVRLTDKPIFLAGIYSHAEPPDLGPVDTFALLTRDAAPEVAHIHDRMPVIVPEADAGDWLDSESSRFRSILEKPLIAGFESYRVDARMNSPKFNGPECLRPLPA